MRRSPRNYPRQLVNLLLIACLFYAPLTALRPQATAAAATTQLHQRNSPPLNV